MKHRQFPNTPQLGSNPGRKVPHHVQRNSVQKNAVALTTRAPCEHHCAEESEDAFRKGVG